MSVPSLAPAKGHHQPDPSLASLAEIMDLQTKSRSLRITHERPLTSELHYTQPRAVSEICWKHQETLENGQVQGVF
jgi:hypothetical protein